MIASRERVAFVPERWDVADTPPPENGDEFEFYVDGRLVKWVRAYRVADGYLRRCCDVCRPEKHVDPVTGDLCELEERGTITIRKITPELIARLINRDLERFIDQLVGFGVSLGEAKRAIREFAERYG